MNNGADKGINEVGSTNFLIRIHFQQHASWQGEIQWLDSKEEKTIFFRSLLEMILLMQEAIELDGRVQHDNGLQTWKDVEKQS